MRPDGSRSRSTGDRFEGKFNIGTPDCHTPCVITLANGGRFEGYVKATFSFWKGRLELPNGDYFEGEFDFNPETREREKLHGRAVSKVLDKDGSGYIRYEGNFKYGKKDGVGIAEWSNGDVYKGEFRNDLMHGKGTYTDKSTGKTIEGVWENGVRKDMA